MFYGQYAHTSREYLKKCFLLFYVYGRKRGMEKLWARKKKAENLRRNSGARSGLSRQGR